MGIVQEVLKEGLIKLVAQEVLLPLVFSNTSHMWDRLNLPRFKEGLLTLM